jgi:hypothetical protein
VSQGSLTKKYPNVVKEIATRENDSEDLETFSQKQVNIKLLYFWKKVKDRDKFKAIFYFRNWQK